MDGGLRDHRNGRSVSSLLVLHLPLWLTGCSGRNAGRPGARRAHGRRDRAAATAVPAPPSIGLIECQLSTSHNGPAQYSSFPLPLTIGICHFLQGAFGRFPAGQMRGQKGAICFSATRSATVDSPCCKTWTLRAAQARRYDGVPAELHASTRHICYVGRERLPLADIAPAD